MNQDRLRRILSRMLDENEFFSPYGIRALSRYHNDNPYVIHVAGQEFRVNYLPAESDTGMFGGKLQLAWPHMDAGQCAVDSCPDVVLLLLRR